VCIGWPKNASLEHPAGILKAPKISKKLKLLNFTILGLKNKSMAFHKYGHVSLKIF
jgi:hypothetical protein